MQQIVSLLGANWLSSVLLLSVRIAALLLLTPVLYAVAVPARVRLALVVAASCVIALPFAGDAAARVPDAAALAQGALREAGIGAVLGLGVLVAFAGFQLAGRLIDLQMGFGLAQVLDPVTRQRAPVISALFGLLAALFFFLVDGHHALLRGIAYSVERFPVGAAWTFDGLADTMVRQLAGLFSLGFALAAPVVLALLLVEFALGVVARNLPQANMLVLGVPVKVVAGLVALTAWSAGFGEAARRLYALIYQAWTAWFAAGGGR